MIKRKVGRQKYVQSKKIYQSIFICKVSRPKNVKHERNIKELISVKLAVKNMFQVKQDLLGQVSRLRKREELKLC